MIFSDWVTTNFYLWVYIFIVQYIFTSEFKDSADKYVFSKCGKQ